MGGRLWLVILVHTPVIYMFTPQPPTRTKSVSHLSNPLTRLCTCEWSVCPTVCVCVCTRVWVRLLFLFVCVWLIPSARKCPEARIGS